MGTRRNGARTVLDLLAKACKMSRLPGFRNGVFAILGDDATAFFAVWDPMCAAVDLLISADNWYNQIDYHIDVAGNEDVIPA
jgi:hypothetical protein